MHISSFFMGDYLQVACYSDGFLKVFELTNPLELKNWQLQVIRDFIFYPVLVDHRCNTFMHCMLLSTLRSFIYECLIRIHLLFTRPSSRMLLILFPHFEKLHACQRQFLGIQWEVMARSWVSLWVSIQTHLNLIPPRPVLLFQSCLSSYRIFYKAFFSWFLVENCHVVCLTKFYHDNITWSFLQLKFNLKLMNIFTPILLPSISKK